MGEQLEVGWTDEVTAPPEAVWDAITDDPAPSRSSAPPTTGTGPASAGGSAPGPHRIYGRDRWRWPVSVAHHLFAPVDRDAVRSTFVADGYERETA